MSRDSGGGDRGLGEGAADVVLAEIVSGLSASAVEAAGLRRGRPQLAVEGASGITTSSLGARRSW